MSDHPTEELLAIHERRIKLISEKRKEMNDLRQENEELKRLLAEHNIHLPLTTKVDAHQQTEVFEVPGEPNTSDLQGQIEDLQAEIDDKNQIKQENLELQKNIAELQDDLQKANSAIAAFEDERQKYKTHVAALKDIIAVSKQLLLMREGQIKELTSKVDDIQASLTEKEFSLLSDNLRQEYERQLKNIKQLKVLYEERQAADKTEKDRLKGELEESTSALNTQENKTTELQERVDELEQEVDVKQDAVYNLESQLGLAKADCRELRAEMDAINQLFSQILVDFNNGQEIDLDKLVKTLEENHDLLKDIVINEESNAISSALPKVLLDLVNQVNDAETSTNQADSTESKLSVIPEESESQSSSQQNSLNSASEIVQNLPKVWRVLIELLSHQVRPSTNLQEHNEPQDTNPCYKSVQTPTGPTLVLSVSKTFIRLKDLILEKKSLEKETSRLKQLNTHLETRLQDQEKRLETVSTELSQTWHVVGKMQKQHQQLHTQEKILRYELAQKRKLLNELKEELEYCREKWLQAKEKNNTTEEQWKQLRTEFTSRKTAIVEDFNNSAESGYSDERESSSDEEDLYAVNSQDPLIDKETSGEPLNAQNESILEVIQNEIALIEQDETSTQQVNGLPPYSEVDQKAVLPSSQFDESSNSKTLKTDLVQNNDKDIDQTTNPCSSNTKAFYKCDKAEESRKKDIDDMYKKLEEDILLTIKKTQSGEDYPAISHQNTKEDVFINKEEQLKLLEEEISHSVCETSSISDNNNVICTKSVDGGETSGFDAPEEISNLPEPQPGTSSSESTEERLAKREERLQRLEEEAKQLVGKVKNNNLRGFQFSRKLSKLHDRYGDSSESSDGCSQVNNVENNRGSDEVQDGSTKEGGKMP